MWAIAITWRPSSSSLTFLKNLLLWNNRTDFNQTSYNCSLGYWQQSYRLKFLICRKRWPPVTKNRTGGVREQFFANNSKNESRYSKFCDILGRSARQDLSAVRFLWWSVKSCFFVVFIQIFQLLTFNNSRTKAGIKIPKDRRSFRTTRSICCSIFVTIRETM